MTYIKNNQLIKVLSYGISLQKVHSKEVLYLTYFGLIASTIYILLYEEKHLIKSEKWAPRALKS